jgi:hypothetical protein
VAISQPTYPLPTSDIIAYLGGYTDSVGATKANVSHAHNATTDLTSGTVPTARLGGGAASATTFLRGDQTWAVPAGTSGGSGIDTTGYVAGDVPVYDGVGFSPSPGGTLTDTVLTDETTTSTTFVNLSGPTATVDLVVGSMVLLFFEADIWAIGGGTAQAGIQRNGANQQQCFSTTSGTSETRRLLVNNASGVALNGTTGIFGGSFWMDVCRTAGTYTYAACYRAIAPATAHFSNRRLQLVVTDPREV